MESPDTCLGTYRGRRACAARIGWTGGTLRGTSAGVGTRPRLLIQDTVKGQPSVTKLFDPKKSEKDETWRYLEVATTNLSHRTRAPRDDDKYRVIPNALSIEIDSDLAECPLRDNYTITKAEDMCGIDGLGILHWEVGDLGAECAAGSCRGVQAPIGPKKPTVSDVLIMGETFLPTLALDYYYFNRNSKFVAWKTIVSLRFPQSLKIGDAELLLLVVSHW
ncbi:uncharacterized protein PITG_15658 [Phytophthora infestans T30-4]|uniref:Uncharacterized protein n=1 Tax=Phytophthora infestans (strain T30-4) TaxID=403677 RepID=D0NS94_PHYIT|nr:uncharacterized protein PITG_15658 [Phytophthora infestans T30-4]EEY64439.1 hypothetical protein PITG_15658 [Phytophthora infestans T30-4]|eukprot:XP_002897942.1 hypothetical protein PITG_15658 [Phytophthora infestans T30-4]